MISFNETKSSTTLGPTEHAPSCTRPPMEWQQVITEGLPRRGRCPECGAVDIYSPPTAPTEPARRRVTRRGATA